MTDLNSKSIFVVKFGEKAENSVFMYVPCLWLTARSGKNVTTVLPDEDEGLSMLDPVFLKKLPSRHWQQYTGTIVYETDNIEEAIQVVNLRNNYAKEATELISSCTDAVTSIIHDISAELPTVEQYGPSTSSGATKRLNPVGILEVIRPIVANLDQYIVNVIKLNRDNPVINEQLDQADIEKVLRLTEFSNNYTEFFRRNMDHHISRLLTKIKSPSVTMDEVISENIKIMSEFMSTFVLTLSVMNGNIN